RPAGRGTDDLGTGRPAGTGTAARGRGTAGGALAAVRAAQPGRTRPFHLGGRDRPVHRRMTPDELRDRFASGRVARLATVDAEGRPHLVPVVFAVVADTIYSAVD